MPILLSETLTFAVHTGHSAIYIRLPNEACCAERLSGGRGFLVVLAIKNIGKRRA